MEARVPAWGSEVSFALTVAVAFCAERVKIDAGVCPPATKDGFASFGKTKRGQSSSPSGPVVLISV